MYETRTTKYWCTLFFTSQTLEGGDGDAGAPAAKSLQDLTSASKKNTEELDDERQYRMLQQDLHGDRGEAARWGTGEVSFVLCIQRCRDMGRQGRSFRSAWRETRTCGGLVGIQVNLLSFRSWVRVPAN